MSEEDQLWKKMYKKTQEAAAAKKAKLGVQQLDEDNFFEKFGSQLKETADASEAVKDAEQEERYKYEERERQQENKKEDTEIRSEPVPYEEPPYNVEDLYGEAIYEFLHLVGQDAGSGIKKDTVFAYLKKTFNMDEAAHNALLCTAKGKQAPKVVLNVEVQEAKNLTPKDANGLSDPYCILYMSSAPTQRFNTDVRRQTLHPVWQDVLFSLNTGGSNDVLHLEVWDLDPAESVAEKISRINEVKGVWGIKKMLKEVTIAAYNGNHNNELIGSLQIPLKSIPTAGLTAWFNLYKKGRTQGMVLLKLVFGSEKDPVVAMAEHRHLIRAIMLEHFSRPQFDGATWDGKFCDEAEILLRQHSAHSNLGYAEKLLAKWVEYCALVSQGGQLNFAVLADILEPLLQRLPLFNEDELRLFWDATKKILAPCYNFLRRINRFTREEAKPKLTGVVRIIRGLSVTAAAPPTVNLFPSDVYGWLKLEDLSILNVLHEAIVNGALHWFEHLLQRHNGEEGNELSKLQEKVKLVDFVNIDLEQSLLHSEDIFSKLLEFPYTKTLFTVYQCRVSEIAEPEAAERCLMIRPIDFEKRDNMEANSLPLLMGTTLFEFYIKLQKLNKIGKAIFREDYEDEDFLISKFYSWFFTGVVRWLDIAAFKAMQRIEKAVDLDTFVPIDSTVQYSSSAVDAIEIFHQIRMFWEQLEWPDVEGCYTFVARIIDDICKCSVHYADQIATKVDHMGETIVSSSEKRFRVTDEWCVAINNIDFVHSNIRPLVNQLGLEKILNSLADFKSEITAEHCRNTLECVMNNTVDTVACKILDLLDTVAKKMEPSMSKFLQDGAELLHQQSDVLDNLMQYLDDSLIKLKSKLNDDNFNRILVVIWDKLSATLCNLVHSGIEKRRPTSFFANLRDTLHLLIGFFKLDECEEQLLSRNEGVVKAERILRLYGMETADLIQEYYRERYAQQRLLQDEKQKIEYGVLAVKLHMTGDVVKVDVLNARSIRPMDSNGYSDPFVSVRLLPKHIFPGTKCTTKVQKKTLFPLFDESFTFQLSGAQQNVDGAMVMFVMKDQDFYGAKNEYMAECFLPLSEAASAQGNQIHLNLHRPSNNDSEALKALDYRQNDKVAKDFVKRQRNRMNVPH